jgi:putative protein-disulfide isomerase
MIKARAVWIVMALNTMILGCLPVDNTKPKTMKNKTNDFEITDIMKTDVEEGFACDLNTGKCSIPSNIKEEIEPPVSEIKSGRLIYVGDPMCSSCFAFASEIKEVKKEFEGILDFQIVLGGLRPFGKEPITTMRDYLTPHFDNLARMTGLPINSEILSDSSFILDTEPPSRAVVVVRKLAPKVELEFYDQVQRVFYLDNSNTNDVETYLGFVEDFGIEKDVFKNRFESNEVKELVKSDFQIAREMGVNSFPTLLLKSNGQISVISKGYSKSAPLIKKVNSYLYSE